MELRCLKCGEAIDYVPRCFIVHREKCGAWPSDVERYEVVTEWPPKWLAWERAMPGVEVIS